MTGKRGFTLIEMLVAFFLATFILGVFYMMHGTYQVRLIKVIQKSRGQQAVRLLMTKLRQELKAATAVYIPSSPPAPEYQDLPYVYTEPRNDVIIIMQGRSNLRDYPGYTIKYEFIREKKAIRFSEYKNRNQLIRQGLFLGGLTQLLGFHAQQSGKTEQILIQKHKVYVEVEYYDMEKTGEKFGDNRELVIPLKASLTVYPRPINMLLKIDVPQG
jgi:prepilin-type N-terminal cleavage/methylation domain-containing protein